MTSAKHGPFTSAAEVTNISPNGLWMLLEGSEVFLPYEQFPWFKEASVRKISHVELPSPGHLYWPELDVDLEVDSILHPERYPLVSQVHEAPAAYVSKAQADVDVEKVDDCVLALLQLTLHEGNRAWKGMDFEVLDRLFEKGYIHDPRNKNKSVVLTQVGLERSRELFESLFGK